RLPAQSRPDRPESAHPRHLVPQSGPPHAITATARAPNSTPRPQQKPSTPPNPVLYSPPTAQPLACPPLPRAPPAQGHPATASAGAVSREAGRDLPARQGQRGRRRHSPPPAHRKEATMRYGFFTMPLHPPGADPAQTLADDLAQLVTLDRLGFSEA